MPQTKVIRLFAWSLLPIHESFLQFPQHIADLPPMDNQIGQIIQRGRLLVDNDHLCPVLLGDLRE